MFTRYMYEGLGVHWASSIPAFLTVACIPFPFLFWKYGEKIRMKCEFAAEAARFLDEIHSKKGPSVEEETVCESRILQPVRTHNSTAHQSAPRN